MISFMATVPYLIAISGRFSSSNHVSGSTKPFKDHLPALNAAYYHKSKFLQPPMFTCYVGETNKCCVFPFIY